MSGGRGWRWEEAVCDGACDMRRCEHSRAGVVDCEGDAAVQKVGEGVGCRVGCQRVQLSKTVEDAALLLAALEGRTPADLTASSLRGKRLGVLQTVAFDELREAPALGFETALAVGTSLSARSPMSGRTDSSGEGEAARAVGWTTREG